MHLCMPLVHHPCLGTPSTSACVHTPPRVQHTCTPRTHTWECMYSVGDAPSRACPGLGEPATLSPTLAPSLTFFCPSLTTTTNFSAFQQQSHPASLLHYTPLYMLMSYDSNTFVYIAFYLYRNPNQNHPYKFNTYQFHPRPYHFSNFAAVCLWLGEWWARGEDKTLNFKLLS